MEFDEPIQKATKDVIVGDDLSELSVDELKERVKLLKEEIERVEQEIASKQDSRSTADSFFKS